LADIGGHAVSPSFVRELRRVLNHLYEWPEICRSPLLGLFAVQERDDPPQALRHLLTEAIETFKPESNVSLRARARRTYQLLHSRYIEQFTQKEVATELGLSIRHLRREESLALHTLATYLWTHYDLAPTWQELASALPALDESVAAPDAQAATAEQELDWLQASLPSEPIEVAGLVHSALALIGPTAQATEVRLDCRTPEGLPRLVAQSTPVRQALLNVFATIIHGAPGGQVTVDAWLDDAQICIAVQATGIRTTAELGGDEGERLKMARRLVQLSGGSLHIAAGDEGESSLTITLSLPAEERIPILAIDDNADALRLLEHSLAQSRYRFIGAADPAQALRLAQESHPRIILLDVMLPRIDGWELLGRLRQHPQTRDIPVIICTILPQEGLASDLGAAAFLRKPISRQALLSTLDRQLGLGAPESH